VLLAYLSLLLFPSSEILRVSSRLAAQHGLKLKVAEIGKTLPLGIRARGVAISGGTGTLLALDRLSLRLRFLPLLTGRVIIGYEGSAGQGNLFGEIEATGPARFEINCMGVRLEELPLLQALTSARVTGKLAGSGKLLGQGARAMGTVRVSVEGLEVTGARIGGVMLPDAVRQTVQALVTVGNGVIKLENVTMQGDGLYARLKGEINAGVVTSAAPVNLSLELMPKPDFMERQKFVFLALGRYSDSPGHYLLPIRGTIGRPELQ
jgi:type II secretion system protein N